ncbi:MAG TPA: hypothetical protein VJ793_28110 [Anaerolineae bacterium]|nr:hypothetical protein [Anaerolineae bacterium]
MIAEKDSSLDVAALAVLKSDLEEILRRLDENLARRPVVPERQMDDLNSLSHRVQSLYFMQAPLFAVKERGPWGWLKRLLNLPIRLFGHKQIRFNRETLEVIRSMLAYLQALEAQAKEMARLDRELNQLQEQMQILMTRLNQPPSDDQTATRGNPFPDTSSQR